MVLCNQLLIKRVKFKYIISKDKKIGYLLNGKKKAK